MSIGSGEDLSASIKLKIEPTPPTRIMTIRLLRPNKRKVPSDFNCQFYVNAFLMKDLFVYLSENKQ